METEFRHLSIHVLGNRLGLLEQIRTFFSGSEANEYVRHIDVNGIPDAEIVTLRLLDEGQAVLLIDVSPENGGIHSHFDFIRRMVEWVPIVIITPCRDEELLMSMMGLGVQDVVSETEMSGSVLRKAVLFSLIRFHRNRCQNHYPQTLSIETDSVRRNIPGERNAGPSGFMPADEAGEPCQPSAGLRTVVPDLPGIVPQRSISSTHTMHIHPA